MWVTRFSAACKAARVFAFPYADAMATGVYSCLTFFSSSRHTIPVDMASALSLDVVDPTTVPSRPHEAAGRYVHRCTRKGHHQQEQASLHVSRLSP